MIPAMRKFCILSTAILLVLVTQVTFVNAQGRKKRDAGPTLVRTESVRRMPRATKQSFVGSFEPVRRSVVGSAVEERIEEVFVEEGDFVDINSDRLLVKLRHDTIDIAVESARIELELREKALEELSATIPAEIEAARAEVARLNAELQYARKVYDRTQSLGSSMSKKEVEEAVSQFHSATQAINGARAQLQRLEATSDVRLAIAQGNIARQQSELRRNQDLQEKHSVATPFSGYVSRRMVERGNWVARGTPLVEIVQVDPIQLRIQVPQEYAVTLQRSFDLATEDQPLTAEIEIDSIEEPLQGTVFRIVPDADSRTRALPVIIRVANPSTRDSGDGGHLLKPGLLARASLHIGKGERVLMVPKDALVLNQGATSIYLVDRSAGKPVVRQHSVQTGNSSGNWIEITGDVREDDTVVVQGNERLRDGETVEILEQ